MGIATTNFYKFLCTASLVGLVYCLSFPSVFLEPYNNKTIDFNIQKAELAADIGYLNGRIIDIENQYDFNSHLNNISNLDESKTQKVSYFTFNNYDTTTIVDYYISSNFPPDYRPIVDTLNKYYMQYAKVHFKLTAIQQASKELGSNLTRIEVTMFIFSILFLSIFIYSTRVWYINRVEFDKS